ncbi:hypothetical protein GALMADRAFT_206338 [Galerina marginata CBS 339.88]|uniref:Uncharacterized protein n=1 Tax=Galerina marginata (strain CBS 339.88) TaxID=685588 RepID=A0A067TU54_GALM3|nr:hypothetical protein GALMADRAFT_206338 [Galerina marginata CBS 339.88]
MARVFLVTGGNSSIGFELVRLLAEENHTVYLSARNEAAGKEAQKKLLADGLKTVKFVLLDVTDPATIQAAKETIEKGEGKLDVLVNNAAIGKVDSDQSPVSIALPTLRDAFETNFFGVVQTTTILLPLLRKSSQPVILNVSSELGSNYAQSRPGSRYHPVAYNTTKAALNSYTIALAQELKGEGFKVNAATPGLTSSKLNGFMAGGKSLREGALALLPHALLDKDGPTCKFFDSKGNEFHW